MAISITKVRSKERDMKVSYFFLLFLVPFATPAALAEVATPTNITTNGSREPAPGTVIDAKNGDLYGRLIPVAARLAIKHGFKLDVVPTTRIDWPEAYKQATERYSHQVGLDSNDVIQNYVAGAPFPSVEASDPKAAIKISYDWRWGPFVFDDYTLSQPKIANYTVDASRPFRLSHDDAYDYTATSCIWLRFAHRTAVDPRPAIEPNGQGVEEKMICTGQQEMRYEDCDAALHVRYLDPSKVDDNFYHSRSRRRVDRIDVSYDGEYWGWKSAFLGLPKTELYSWRLLGTALLMSCIGAIHEPAGVVVDGQEARFVDEPFQLRNVWILESVPRDPKWKDLRTITYVDTETYLPLAQEFYQGEEQTAVNMSLWRRVAEGAPFYLAGQIEHVPAGRTYRTGGFSSDARGGESFYFYLLEAGSQKLNSGDVSEDIFNPKQMQ